jgi:hypothetical protein
MRRRKLLTSAGVLLVLSVIGVPEASAQVARPTECQGNVGYSCAREVVLKHTGEECIVYLDPRWPRCVEPATGPDAPFPEPPPLPSAPPMPPSCWHDTDYKCAREYILDIVGGDCIVNLDPRWPRCHEPRELGEPPLPSSTNLCLSPVTCVSPFDNLGTPNVPASATSPGGATTLLSRPPELNCDRRDYITTLKSLSVARTDAPPVVNETPLAAIVRYLPRPTLPPGLSAADWVVHQRSATAEHAYYVTRDATKARILGVIGLERRNGSWEVYYLTACGEYLYPGSLVVDSLNGGEG